MPARSGRRGGRSATDRLVALAVVVVVALTATEEALHLWHRSRTKAARWWEDVEHRERTQIHEAELGMLMRWLRPPR